MLSSQPFFARLAATVAKAMFFIYVITVSAKIFPLRLLDMGWQISVVGVVISNSILPLIGLLLAHLAAYLDPSELRFELFCKNLRRWALPATLGFLLIIPLQSYNMVRGVRNYRQSADSYRRTVNQNFGNLRNAVNNSSTVAELKKRLAELNAPGISEADNLVPLPILRPTLLAEIKKAEARAILSAPELNPEPLWSFGKQTLNSILQALAFALAFAAGAKRSSWNDSLLTNFNRYLQSLRQFFFVNGGKVFKTFNADRKAKVQLSQNNERQRRHSLQMNRLRQQQEKEAKKRLKTNERLRSKDD
jgi:hypothetical protein